MRINKIERELIINKKTSEHKRNLRIIEIGEGKNENNQLGLLV